MKRIGLASNHAGLGLKEMLRKLLLGERFESNNFGPARLVSGDDFPDHVIPLAQVIARGDVQRAIDISAVRRRESRGQQSQRRSCRPLARHLLGHRAPFTYVLIVWAYSLAWLLIINALKVGRYKLLGWKQDLKA